MVFSFILFGLTVNVCVFVPVCVQGAFRPSPMFFLYVFVVVAVLNVKKYMPQLFKLYH